MSERTEANANVDRLFPRYRMLQGRGVIRDGREVVLGRSKGRDHRSKDGESKRVTCQAAGYQLSLSTAPVAGEGADYSQANQPGPCLRVHVDDGAAKRFTDP